MLINSFSLQEQKLIFLVIIVKDSIDINRKGCVYYHVFKLLA